MMSTPETPRETEARAYAAFCRAASEIRTSEDRAAAESRRDQARQEWIEARGEARAADYATRRAETAVAAAKGVRALLFATGGYSLSEVAELVRAYADARVSELAPIEQCFCSRIEGRTVGFTDTRAVRGMLLHYWLLDYPPGFEPEFTCRICFSGSGAPGTCGKCGNASYSPLSRSEAECWLHDLTFVLKAIAPL